MVYERGRIRGCVSGVLERVSGNVYEILLESVIEGASEGV